MKKKLDIAKVKMMLAEFNRLKTFAELVCSANEMLREEDHRRELL